MGRIIWIFSLFLSLSLPPLYGARIQENIVLMGTTVQIILEDGSKREEKLREILGNTVAYLTTLSERLSVYSSRSEVAFFNQAPVNEEIKVSSLLYSLLEASREISRQTKGSFDITVFPLVKLWGFYKKERKVPPSLEEILSLLPRVGYYYLELLPGGGVIKKKDVQIDLSGIAKGFIVDSGIEFIRRQKVKAALINAGGDLRVYGKRWRIGVAVPRNPRGVLGVITLREGAVATSGDYQKFWEYKGKRFHHIIDPRSGYPAESGIISATVLSPQCWRADALATALVVGGEEGLEWLKKKEEALLVKEENLEIVMSKGMKKYFQKLR